MMSFKNYIKAFCLLILVSGCATGTSSNYSHPKSDSTAGQLDLETGEPTAESRQSSDNNDSSHDSDVQATPVEKRDVSASEKKFEAAVNGQREDDMIKAGSEILAQKPDDPRVLNGFAQYYIHAGYNDLARIYLNRIIDKDPKNAAANNALGVISMKENKDADAQAFFKRALLGDDSQPEANGNLGTFYIKYMDYDKAAMFLEKAYDHDKKNVAVANNYAIALRGLGKYDDAMSIYKSIESKGNKIQVLLNEAILMSEYKKDFNEAKSILNKIRFISTDPAVLKKVNALVSKMGTTK